MANRFLEALLVGTLALGSAAIAGEPAQLQNVTQGTADPGNYLRSRCKLNAQYRRWTGNKVLAGILIEPSEGEVYARALSCVAGLNGDQKKKEGLALKALGEHKFRPKDECAYLLPDLATAPEAYCSETPHYLVLRNTLFKCCRTDADADSLIQHQMRVLAAMEGGLGIGDQHIRRDNIGKDLRPEYLQTLVEADAAQTELGGIIVTYSQKGTLPVSKEYWRKCLLDYAHTLETLDKPDTEVERTLARMQQVSWLKAEKKGSTYTFTFELIKDKVVIEDKPQ